MSKPLIKIFTYVDGVNDTPFPNEENQLIIPEYSFSESRMGSVNLTATAMYPTCLDDKWVTGKQYADFRGERYFIVKTPSSSKSNDDVRYKHDIEFVSERNILETIYFYDVVSDNTSVDRYVSNSTKVLFYGDVHELVARLNYSLEYSQVAYRLVVDAGITSEVKQVSLEDVFVFDAIQEIFNIFELPFYFVGKTCHVGFTDNAITHTFRYGKDYELLSINKTNANYKITNRVTGTGSSDNIQFYYPNPSNDRAAIEAAGGKWITPAGTLMPPIYRDTDGAERFYNAINKRYINPETGEYYVFENEFTTASQKEQIVTFEDIKPTIKNTLNAAGLRIDEIIDVAFDKDDNDEVDESTGDYVHSYFYVKLNRFSGDYGFNLFEQPIVGSDASIVMTSGNCNACTFQIGVVEVEEDGKTVFKNPVQVDKNGNIAEGNYADKVKPNNIQASQQDTTQNEVWIALKKDNTTFGMVMPNKNGNIRPSYGDSFVIINIDMPQTYIYKAENELEEAILKYMANNNSEKFTFSIKLSRIFLAENPAVEALINSSARIDLEYNGKYHQLYVSSYTYRSDSEVLPEITIELADTLTISKNSIQTSIDSVKQDIMNTIGGVDFLKQGLKYFLRKDTEDIARFFISFLRGIKIGNYVSGGDIGGIFAVDGNGKTFIETDFLKVRMKAYFETLEIINTGSIAGRQIITPGGSIKCIKVVDREEIINEDGEKEEKIWNFYRCYFLAEQDGVKVENRFRKNDQALSQDFNIKEGVYENVSNHYYWRLVVGVGDDYIDLSKTDADTKSDAPAIGDVICQLGHRDDKAPERQNAMIFSAVDLYSPSLTMYAGINSYSYVNKDYISYGVDKTTNKAFMNVYGDTYIGDRNRTSYMEFKTGKGLKIKGQLEVGSTIGNGSTIEDALDKATQDAIDAATEDLTNYAKEVTESLNNIQYQIDGQIESFFEKYSPTLTNKPAVDWTTEELKKQHANDTFTNIDTGESWKWVKDGTTWKWSVIEDTATLKALAAASKAQDTADGKRRVFVVKPTTEQAYDVGDLWVNATYGTTYHNDILRAKTAKKAGEAFNISHWELASKYTDDTKANEAAAAAAEAQEAAEQAATAVDNLNTYVDGAFKDGVIEESEAQAIEKYINIVDNAKKTTDAAYTKLYANTYLTGAAKTGLKSAKDKLDIATTNLINSINTAIADGQTTVAEKNDVDAKFAAYNTANEAFSTAVEVANGAIQDLLKSYSDQAKEAAVAAQAAADAAQAAADSASDAVDDLNGYVDGAFKDGVIDEAEAKAIEKYINVVNGSKAATDATYTKLYSNKYLLGTAKENLKTAKDKLDVATTALLTSIQSAIADGKTTAEEKAAVDAKYADFNKANEDFNTAIEAANLSIQNMLKSYADAALAAAEAAQSSADAAKTAADNAAGAVGDLNDYVDGAFKDGIIDASEAQAIEKYINIVNNTKGEVKATFDKLYANVYLTGAAKTGLNSSYTALNTAITNLLNSINTAIADGKTTEAEKSDVDLKYTSFNTAYASFNTAVETANKAIQDKLKTFADDAKALAESAQAVADAAKDRLDSWAEDGVISPTEKQGIKDEIARIKADKDNITAGYKLYNLGEATAYITAYTDYYNSLLALSDTTKETIEIPTDFATKQTKYYTERTAALNAIASASKSAVDAAQAAADAAKSRLDSWAADGVISPAEKQSIKDERARILADKADITTGYTRYNLGTPTDYNTAYTAYDTALAALSKDTPEVITIPSDFATKQKNYYTKRTAAISAIDAATKSNADAAAAAAAKAQEDIDSVKTDINKINSDVAGLKNFTDDAFADGVVDRGEASAIGAYLKSIATVKADVDKSYTEVYANPLLAGTAKTTLNTTYTAFGKAVEELTTVIEAVVEKGIADATDRASVNGKYDAFNTKYGDFVKALNAANTYIQDQIDSKAENALTEAVSYRYLKKAFSEYTIIEGGLVQNSLNVLGYTNDKKEFVVQAGMSGLYDASATGGGIAAWYGGSMKDYFDYTDLDRPKDVAKGVDRMDGTGYRANGNLWWDLNGKVHADPLSFFVGEATVGGLLASFQVVMTNNKPDYLIPKVPFQDLTISNNLTVGGDIILKDGILKWDAANNAFYVEKKDGSIASFYATGEVSAGGVGSGGSGGGGGLIENVYSSSSLGDEFSDSDLNNTFNAYSINQIYLDVKNLKSGAAVSLVVNGTGTVLTNIVKTGSTITATKGNLAFSSLTGKPTTISGYGITDAYTKTQADGKYVLKSGSNMTGTLNWVGADANIYPILLGTNHYISIDGSAGSSMLHWDGTRTHVGSLNGSVAIRSNATDLIHNYNGTGYIILDARNYNNYAPKKDGTGAGGSWAINVLGWAHRLHQALENKTAEQVFTDNGVYYYQVSSAEDTGYPTDYGHGLMLQRSSGATLTSSQAVLDIFTPTSGTNLVYLRTGIGNGTKITWQAFQQILHTGNYTSLITKLGTTTVGSTVKPFYLNAGVPTAFTTTVGSASLPVYMNAGTITQCSTTLGVSITGTAPRLTTTELTNQDLNSYTYTNYSGKLYYAGGSNTTTNVPSGVDAYGLMVWRIATRYTGHLMFDSAGDFRARFHNGTTWSAWDKLAYITDNVASATKLQTARTINGTSFNGTANITTANWGTARNLTIGGAVKSVNGSANVSFSLNEINAAYGRNVTYTGTTTEQGWCRLASTQVGINPTNALFFISVTVSGYHSTFLLQVSTAYGNNPSLIQLGGSNYSNSSVDLFRLVYHTTYANHYAYLEVRTVKSIKDTTFNVFLVGRANTTWTLSTALTAGSIPEGYTSKILSPASASIVAPTFRGALVGNVTGNLTGNASTATSLQTARTLWGQSFNGTANITGTLLGVESLVARSGRINNFSGYFDNSGNPATGTICITLPNGWTSSMNIYEIWIYEYNTTANASVITIGAYNYNGGGTASSAKWVNIGYHTKGAYSKGVRLAYNGSKCVILLGTTATKWYDPKVYLKTIYTGHSNQTIWGGTSTISLITSETGYTNIDTPARMDEFFGDTSVTGKLAVTGAGHFGHTYTSMTAGINVKGDSATTGICLYDGTGTTARLYRKGDILYITRAGNDASGILMSVAGSIYPGANNTLTNGTTTNRWSNVCTQLLNVAGVGTFASHIAVSGEVRSTSAKAFRAVQGSYGFFIYNDSSSTYFMLTNKDDQYGSYNTLRPLYINNSTGVVSSATGIVSGGVLNVSNTTDATATTVAAIKTAGGIGVAKQLRVGGAVTFGSTLSVTGQITASGGLRIGNYYLKSTADGLALTHVTTGTVANFYATGEVSAGGVGSGGSGGGGGLIENVYSSSSLGDEFSDSDLNNTFNAYSINQIYLDVKNLKSGAAVSLVVNGTGTVLTNIVKTGSTITATKGNLAFSSLTGKPTTISGYGITDAYTKTQADGKYVLKSGSNMTGTLNWVGADANIYPILLGTNHYISIDGSAGSSMLHWDGTRTHVGSLNGSVAIRSNATDLIHNYNGTGYIILDARNYNNYAPKKDGTGAGGSWAINVLGWAHRLHQALENKTAEQVFTDNGVYYYQVSSAEDTGYPTDYGHGLMLQRSSGATLTSSQAVLDIFTPTSGTNLVYLRTGIGNGTKITWQAFQQILHTGNYTSLITKLGTTTVGSTVKPFYLNAGVPTAFTTTVGSASLPVYMNAGTITQCSTTLGVSITGTAPRLTTTELTNQDLNSYTYTNYSGKLYYAGGSNTTTNVPSGVDAYGLMVWRIATRYTGHLMFDSAGDFRARFHNGTTWSAWDKLAYITDNVASATKLQTARTINGTSFNGTANITTANWGTARNLTIGGAVKSVNGSANVSFSLNEINAAYGRNVTYTGTTTEQGWCRLASTQVGINPTNALFFISVTVSGYHSTFLLQVSTAYGNNPSLIQLGGSNYSNSSVDLFRLVYHTTYANHYAYLEVRTVKSIKDTTFNVFLVGRANTTWTLSTALTAGSIPEGYTSKILSPASASIVAPTFRGALVGNVTGNLTGNASTATSLQTARTLWGQSFNGTANITGTLLGVESLVARSGRINNFSGYFDNSGNPATGTICITLPNGWTSSMNIYEIWIYEYNTTANASVITIGAYNYNGGGTASSAKWVNIGYHTKGAYSKGVRLAYNGSKCVILLGTTATKWYDPKVYLKTIYTGHSNQTIWGGTSTISLITSETGYTNIDTPARMDEFFGDTSVTGKLAVTGAGHFGHTYTSMTGGINVIGNSQANGICLYDGSGSTARLCRINDILYITRAGDNTKGLSIAVSGLVTAQQSLAVTGTITGTSTIQGTQLKSTVATGTAPLTVASTTMVTNLNAQMVGGIGASNIPLEYDASYTPTGTAARWIRIAYFDYTSAIGSYSGTFAISNTFNNDTNRGFIFNVTTSHGTQAPVITQVGGDNGVFTSVRIVKDTTTTYPTAAKVYLEVYYNSTSAGNAVYVSYRPENRSRNKWVLYTTYTAGSIPTGYTAIATLTTTIGMATTGGLRVQQSVSILGNTNHNSRLSINNLGYIYPYSTSTRSAGMYGVYDSAKIGHIWSMGTTYKIPDDGANFGNLYGFAYKHTNNATGGNMATGHQAVWCENGTPRVAIGTNFWVANAATVGGALTANTVTIKNTEAKSHLTFSRGNFNYITAPASGIIGFVVNGQAVGEATADLIIQNGVLKAGATNATALGQDTRRWSNMYSVLLNVSGVATLSSTVNIAGVLNANNATDATSTTAAGAVFDGGVGIAKQLRVGGNVTIAGNVTFATSGLLSVPYSGGQWISLATRTNLIAGNQNTSEASAHALYRVKSFAGDAVVFGGLKNSIGFYGFYKTRIDSGDSNYDWRTVWDSTTGKLLHSKAFEVSGAVTFSSTLTVASTATFSSTTDATSTTAAAVKVTGGLGVAKQLRVGSAATFSSTLSVSSTLNVSGVVNANNATDATSTTAASLVCDGGVGIVKQLRVGGATTLSSTLSAAGIVSFTNATDATSTTAAAVKITGGLGVAKQLRVGSNAVFTKGIYINGNTTGDESITLGTSGNKKIKMGAGGSPGTRWSEIAFFPNFANNGGFTDINLNIQAEGTIQMSSQAKSIWISGGNIAASGEVSAGSTSDRNLKKNFSLEDYQQRVLDLGMVQDFEYREEEMKRAVRTYKPGRHTSLIAQDIKSCTSMVSKDKDGYLKINPLDKEFLFTVVGAVQLNVLGLREVKSEVEILKDEIRELKKRIEYLESLK